MIPILYEKDEQYFTSNGLGRLRDCISCTVIEERNGVYECDFEYPITGAHFDDIMLGRIIAVEHDQTNDIQPFDIVSCSRTISGTVTFHAVHISYRLGHIIEAGNNIKTLQGAFNYLASLPNMPFTFTSDMANSAGYVAAFDGIPRSVKEVLGGMDGSILDTFHGEYRWDKFKVALLSSRGSAKDVTIRYGVNLLDYTEDLDYSEAYTRAEAYWINDNEIVKGALVDSGASSYNGRNDAVALDMSDKYETKPSQIELSAAAIDYMRANNTNLPSQNVTVNFAIADNSNGDASISELSKCSLCDSIRIVFPRYNMNGLFKIVKTIYNVLFDKYDSMELGSLSTSLSQAMGVSTGTAANGAVSKNGSFTPSITASTGTLTGRQVYVNGRWAQLNIVFQKSTVTAAGANVFVGTLESQYRPINTIRGATFYGSNAIIGELTTDGTITVRNTGAQLAAITGNNTIGITFAYLMA